MADEVIAGNSPTSELNKFSANSATRFLIGGRSEYCRCGHSYHEHRANHIAYWFDAVYGKNIVPACTRCNCEKFSHYGQVSQGVRP